MVLPKEVFNLSDGREIIKEIQEHKEKKMAMTPEKKVKQAVAKLLKEAGAYYFFPATGGYGRSGVPDIVGCLDGNFFGIECKAGKNTTTALQQLELAKIARSGGRAIVVNEDRMESFKNSLLDPTSFHYLGEMVDDEVYEED